MVKITGDKMWSEIEFSGCNSIVLNAFYKPELQSFFGSLKQEGYISTDDRLMGLHRCVWKIKIDGTESTDGFSVLSVKINITACNPHYFFDFHPLKIPPFCHRKQHILKTNILPSCHKCESNHDGDLLLRDTCFGVTQIWFNR